MSPAKPAADGEDATPAPVDTKPSAMLPLERKLGFGLAAFAAGLAAVAAATGPSPGVAALEMVTAVGLGVAVWRAHRVVTMFAGLIAGLLVPSVPIQLVFIVYSGFLMLRFNKAQAKANAARPRLTAQQRREAKAARATARGRSTGAGRGAEAVARPAARQPAPNRRYTPPKSKPTMKK